MELTKTQEKYYRLPDCTIVTIFGNNEAKCLKFEAEYLHIKGIDVISSRCCGIRYIQVSEKDVEKMISLGYEKISKGTIGNDCFFKPFSTIPKECIVNYYKIGDGWARF